MPDPSCDSCRFADISMIDEVDMGETPHRICRRYPPQMVGGHDYAGSSFPLVHEGDWCGEWQASNG